jgi:hypothetical protein
LVVALALRRRPAITTFCIADCHTFARRYRERLNKFHRLDCRFSVADLEVVMGRRPITIFARDRLVVGAQRT